MAFVRALVAEVHNARGATIRANRAIPPADRGEVIDCRLLIGERFEEVVKAAELLHHDNALVH
jgi:hypothetical protein